MQTDAAVWWSSESLRGRKMKGWVWKMKGCVWKMEKVASVIVMTWKVSGTGQGGGNRMHRGGLDALVLGIAIPLARGLLPGACGVWQRRGVRERGWIYLRDVRCVGWRERDGPMSPAGFHLLDSTQRSFQASSLNCSLKNTLA